MLRLVQLLLAILIFVLTNSFVVESQSRPTANRPNIVLILSDDQETRSVEFMPKLQQLLISKGTTFSNAFVTEPLCCPSRSSILRGQYPHNHQVLENDAPDGGFEKFRALGNENSTIATWLQGAGYQTALIGKYLNGYPERDDRTYVPPGWTQWLATDGSAKGFNYIMNNNGQIINFGNAPEDYATDVFARKATDLIKLWSSEKRPFFLYISVPAPHEPAVPAPRHAELFQNLQAPRPPSFNEADVSDKPSKIRELPLLNEQQIAEVDDLYRRRLRSLQSVDDLIETVINTLKTSKVLNNTYVIYFSDNGYKLGEHRDVGKGSAYEEDIRVPMFVRGPGVPAGKKLNHFVLNQDLAPTFAEMAGAEKPDFIDGRSLMPLLRTSPPKESRWRTSFLVETPRYRAVRTSKYSFVERKNGERELYDLTKDPFQLDSIHNAVDNNLLDMLFTRMQLLANCAGQGCRDAEQLPIP